MMMRGITLILVLLAFLAVLAAPVAGASTEVHIVLYAADGYTVLNETTVDYRWMEANLPVRGDGTTHYYLQGPVFVNNPDERWNPEEDTNVLEKDMGAVKGTDLRDLCELVGGMEPGDTVTLRAIDGFTKTFAYENVYEPSARQGEMVIAWYQANQSYVPGYADGMRLIFFADPSTNPWGVHALGNEDWHESAAEEYWYYYYQDGQLYPTTTGLSVKYISEVQIWSIREPVGSINVVSEPAGARVYLDGTDTGFNTPCTLKDLSEGFYSLSVQKAGYITPEEESVEVTPGRKTPVRFDLVALQQGGGDSGSADGGGEVVLPGTDEAIFLGGQLSGAENLKFNGSFLLLSSATPPFALTGGKEGLVAFHTASLSRPPALLRLYVFLDESSDDPGVGAEPQVLVSTRLGEIAPVRTYSETGNDEDHPYAATLVYTLPQGTDNWNFTIQSRNRPSWNTTVAGALLLAVYEDPDGMETWASVSEGADIIGDVSGQETPMTLAEFGGEFPTQKPVNTTLFTATTPSSAAGNLSFFVNGVSSPGRLIPGGGAVTVSAIPVPGLPEQAVLRLHIGTREPVVTNRIAILTVETPQKAGILSPPPGGTTRVPNQTSVSTSNTSMRPPVETTSGEGPAAGGHHEPADDPIGTFLCWLLNLILALSGQPPENCNQEKVPAIPVNETAVPTLDNAGPTKFLSTVTISSSPDGAEVYFDDQETGQVTPCEIDISLGGEHSIRVVKEGYQPFEQMVTGSAELNITLHPVSPLPAETGTLILPTAMSHHGGVSIHSYPEKAEIRIDGILAGTSTPLLVSPLKEGFHTITAGIPAGTNGYSARESIRTWVFPDAIVPVEFNLMDIAVSDFVIITGDPRTGAQFTTNGYYPVKRIPERVEFIENPSFITLVNGSSYLSFTIPASSLESGQFAVPAADPPVCNLSIESAPDGAEIFLDGIRTGLLTPAFIPNVSAGYHRISITARGRIPVTGLISIAESQCMQGDYRARYPLEWYPSGSLYLTSDPPGAAVSIRGLKTGEVTPCTLDDIPIGVWEVTLTYGKTKKGIDATVEPGKTRTYSVVFD